MTEEMINEFEKEAEAAGCDVIHLEPETSEYEHGEENGNKNDVAGIALLLVAGAAAGGILVKTVPKIPKALKKGVKWCKKTFSRKKNKDSNIIDIDAEDVVDKNE